MTLKRKAILIGASEDEEEYLPGVKKDIQSYKNFLMSPYGGMWYENEIDILLDEDIWSVRDKLLEVFGEYDFVFLVFSGHGNYDLQERQRRLYFGNDYLYEKELLNLALKQLTIIDCCAGIEEEIEYRARFFMESAKGIIDYRNYRKKYDDYILSCPSQQIILYASSLGEYAKEIEKGGIYTVCLLETAYSNEEYNILTALKAHELATECVRERTENMQNPDYHISRRSGKKLPFSLKVI